MIGPLLTSKVNETLHAAARAGSATVECSLDLHRSTTTVHLGVAAWSWRGAEFPYLDTCRDRTIYHWTGESFRPVSRYANALIKLVPTEWGPPTYEIDGIKIVWKDCVQDVEALAIFHGPETYITPSSYPTKAETGKPVPTWNYVTVHAYGTLRIIEDTAWLRSHLDALTHHNEAAFPHPWQLSDAPADYLNKLMEGIVGIEIVIARLVGKWKTSQNQPQQNQVGIVRGLRAIEHTDALQMASLVEKHHAP